MVRYEVNAVINIMGQSIIESYSKCFAIVLANSEASFATQKRGREREREREKRRRKKKKIKKASSCACQLSPEVTPYHSGSLSHH